MHDTCRDNQSVELLAITVQTLFHNTRYFWCLLDISRSWPGVLHTTLCEKVCQWLATGRWFSPGTPVFSTNKINAKIYSWNIVESGVKYHKFPLKLLHCYLLGCFIPHILRSVCMNINIYSFLETVLRCNLCVKIWRWNINWKAFIWHYLLIAHHLSKSNYLWQFCAH